MFELKKERQYDDYSNSGSKEYPFTNKASNLSSPIKPHELLDLTKPITGTTSYQ